MKFKHKHAAFGGTFDLLHKGHISLLETAFKKSQKVSIGITTDKMIKASGKIPFENEQTRLKNLKAFLAQNKLAERAKTVWLDDIYGSTLKDKSLEALVVSRETLANAKLINQKRQKNKLSKLTIVTCREVLAEDGKKISSGRIKNGEIDRNGLSFKLALQKIAGRRLSEKVRAKLKKPFGPYVSIDKKTPDPDTAVGDVTVANFLKSGKTPRISIVDFYVHRERRFSSLDELGFKSNNPDTIVKNSPGLISVSLIAEIEKSLARKNRSIILVDGEEDLAAVVAILLSPLGSTVFYGQPQKAAVKVTVTEEVKAKLLRLILKDQPSLSTSRLLYQQ